MHMLTYRLAIRSSDVGSLISFVTKHDIKFHHLAIANRAYSLFWIVLYDGCLMYEYILFGVIAIDKAISAFHVKPFNGSRNFFG